MSNRALLLTAALAGIVAAGVLSAVAVGGVGNSQEPPPGRPTPPIPILNRWIRPDTGVFYMAAGPWDNRELPAEQKAATPWYDPRWKPFGACMRAAGFEVRTEPSKPVNQSDIDRIIGRLNSQNPDRAANKRIRPGDYSMGGFTGAFLQCADRWLAIQSEDFEKNGIRMLNPGEIPDP